jgi:glycosyltransferase involved in cell wall biosynthesis
VIKQTYTNIEIIVVDDCSTDKTVPLIKSLMKKEPRLQLFMNLENKGANYTRNRGIKHAKGKYISFLDSDDEWFPETIEILWKEIKNTSEKVGLVYPGLIFITNRYQRKIYPKFRGNVFRDLMTKGTIGSYPLIKHEVFAKSGLFDESEALRKGGNQEYELWIRISQYYEFECVNKILLKHYFQSDSITFKSTIKRPITKIKSFLYIWNKYKLYFGEDTEAYVFFCYKIFELLKEGYQKKLAKKIIFMALKTNILKLRTYYHLIFYLHNYYSPIDILSRVRSLASQLKEWFEGFKFHFSN